MRIVFTAGVFDLCHKGHLNLFKQMRKEGDLVLAVIHDGFTTFKNKGKLPIESLEKRTRNLIDTGLVDIIRYTFEEEPRQAFEELIRYYGGLKGFDLLFMRGDDWFDFPAKDVIRKYSIPIKFVSYTPDVSSSMLRNKL